MKERKKKNIIHKVFSTLALLVSLSYLTYKIVNIDSILNNIIILSIPLFIFLISLIIFIFSLKSENKKLFIITSLLLIFFTGFYFINDLNIITLPKEEVLLSYKNKSYLDFKEWADSKNIKIVVEYENSDTIEKGKIIRLDKNEGTLVKDIKTINVVVSDGPNPDKLLIIPSMLGWNVDDVITYVKENFMTNVIVDFEFSTSEKDIVIKQSVNGEIRRSEELTITVSLGNENDVIKNVEMIDLSNKTLFESSIWLKRNCINYELNYEFSDNIDKDIILNQSIKSGEEVNIDENVITLTVSKGKAITIVDFTKMDVNEVTDWIIKNDLKIKFEEIYDESIETGKIIKQDIEVGTKVATNTLITITISRGQIKMEKFESLYEFKEWANKYNIKYNESYEYSNSVAKGKVISYSYKEDEIIDPDDVVYVKVSLGKAITIPSFIGKSKTEIQNTCNNLGLRCSFTTGTYTKYNANIAYAQSRTAGSKVASGSSITITLSKGIPTTSKLYINGSLTISGSADTTISLLTDFFNKNYPGVNFIFKKVKHNTLNNGMISDNSPTNAGSSVTQGKTYTIYIVSN